MDSPAIVGPRGRRSIPELCLQELAARRVETAQVRNGSRVVAAQLGIGTALGEVTHDALPAAEDDLRASNGQLAESAERRHVWRFCCC